MSINANRRRRLLCEEIHEDITEHMNDRDIHRGATEPLYMHRCVIYDSGIDSNGRDAAYISSRIYAEVIIVDNRNNPKSISDVALWLYNNNYRSLTTGYMSPSFKNTSGCLIYAPGSSSLKCVNEGQVDYDLGMNWFAVKDHIYNL